MEGQVGAGGNAIHSETSRIRPPDERMIQRNRFLPMEEEQGSLKGNSNSGLVLGSFPPTFISDPLNFSKSQQEGASVGRAISCSLVNYLRVR